jgi:hypothetical protein
MEKEEDQILVWTNALLKISQDLFRVVKEVCEKFWDSIFY